MQALGEGLAAHPPTGAVLVDGVRTSDAGPALAQFRRRGMRKCDVVGVVVPKVPRIELEAVDAVRGLQCLQLPVEPCDGVRVRRVQHCAESVPPPPHDGFAIASGDEEATALEDAKHRAVRAHERNHPQHHRASPGVELVDHGARVGKAGTVEAPHAVVLGPQVVDDDEPGRESSVQHSLHVVEYARLRGPVGHLDPRVVLRPREHGLCRGAP